MFSGNSVERQPGSELPSRARHSERPLGLLALLTLVVGTAVSLSCALLLRPGRLTGLLSAGTDLGKTALRPLLYGVDGILAFFLLFSLVKLITIAVRARSQAKSEPATTAEQFIAEASLLHIDPRIAREAFQLLTSVFPEGTSLHPHNDLRGKLNLSEQQIGILLAELPGLCDRLKVPTDRSTVLSVYDLLAHIEGSPAPRLDVVDQRSTATAAPVASISPGDALKNASPRDSRFRTRAHFSGLKRRASDYSGPHRRATDRRPDENYSGPLRRASDRQPFDPSSPGKPESDRRVADRRSSAFTLAESQTTSLPASEEARQHKAWPADATLLDKKLDPRVDVAGPKGNPDHDPAILPASLPRESSAHPASGLRSN